MNSTGKRTASAAIAACLFLTSCTRVGNPAAAGGPPPAPVRAAAAEVRTLPVEVRAIGNVEAFRTISVKSQITGVLMRANFREGEPVRKGQLLFEIDPRPYEEAIRQIEANLARDTALLKQAEANLARDAAQEKFAREQADRFAELGRQGVFSRLQSDQAVSDAESRTASVRADKAAIDSSRSALEADRAALSNARLQLSYCSIVSPVDGRTGNISVKEGNLVKATDVELVTIAQIQPVYVTFAVPEKNLPAIRDRLRSGNVPVKAIVQGNAAASETGELSFVNNQVDLGTGTIKLKATFHNQKARLWPGQFVDAVLTLGQRPNLVTVPNKAIQTGQNGLYVFVVKADQTVEMRGVVTGETVNGLVEVRDGLQAGEQVVTEGHIRLAGGTRVRVQS